MCVVYLVAVLLEILKLVLEINIFSSLAGSISGQLLILHEILKSER